MVAAAGPQCQPGWVLGAPSSWSPCWDPFDRNCNSWLRPNQIRRLPGLAEHLKQHLGRFLEKHDQVAQIGGMALDLAADLQPIAQQYRPQLRDHLLASISLLPEATAQIALRAGFMAGGVDLLMCLGGAERSR